MLGVLVLSQVLLIGGPAKVSQAAGVCSTNNQWLYGAIYDPTQSEHAYGSLADISIRQARYCSGAFAFSNAWSMLQNGEGGGWAQIGWIRQSTLSQRRFFYQATPDGTGCPNSGNCETSFFGDPVIDIKYRFKVVWDAVGTDHLLLARCNDGGTNCVTFLETTWNPSSAGWGNTLATWAGETLYNQSDMPGTASKRTNFNPIQSKLCCPTDWFNVTTAYKCTQRVGSGSCNDSLSRYHFTWNNQPQDSAFQIWTDPI